MFMKNEQPGSATGKVSEALRASISACPITSR